MNQSKSLAWLAVTAAVSGALLVVACSDDDGSTSNTSNTDAGSTPPPGTPGSSGNPPTPNPTPSGTDAGADGGDGGSLTNVPLGGACTEDSDESTECTSMVCYTFGSGGGGGGGGGGGAKKGTFCTKSCDMPGDPDPTCDDDAMTGNCNGEGYCTFKQ